MTNGYLSEPDTAYTWAKTNDKPIFNCPEVTYSHPQYTSYIINYRFPPPDWASYSVPWKKLSKVKSSAMYLIEQEDENSPIAYNGRMAYYGVKFGSSDRNFGNISTLHDSRVNTLFVGGVVKAIDYDLITTNTWEGWQD